MTSVLRACILEDHPMMRENVRRRIETFGDQWRVTYCGDDIHAAIDIGDRDPFDCVLLDLDLGERARSTDVEFVISKGWPVVLISVAGDPGRVQEGIRRGACGFLAKHGDLADLERALAAACQGQVLVTSDLAAKLASPCITGVTLTSEEQRVLMLLASGVGLDAIGRAVGCSESQVHDVLDCIVDRYRAEI